ncbi:hypothetical protein P6144_12585 [Sphingomonas sp. HITSZ_GF]|uniref:hypothetical protein n=1 Tax=Sphingomonas sp. HITSZ_GF TaxID=3037247 RepID=UPI00240CEF48|nr:hypothetical protein [Sphingomonas sp. HITSZ_GF]MDG2534491.1 hypothetical protein [Sphingomonas sp. HITSZ_GF]
MTGPNWARQAIALAGILSLCGCAISGAALLQAGGNAVIGRFDADKDGALDGAELAALVAAAVPGEGAPLDLLRAGLLAGYMARDCDADGRVTPAELATGQACVGTGP